MTTTYVSDGDLATPANFNSWFNAAGGDVFNVKAAEYGAAGDGVTDDTAAIQAALADLPTGGGVVLLPPGTYLVTGTLTVPRGAVIQGASSRATIISHTANGVLFSAHGDGTNIVYSQRVFRDFRIDGNSGAAAVGISIGGIYRAEIRNVHVEDYTGYIGIHIDNDVQWTEGLTMDNVHVRNCGTCVKFERGAGTDSLAETRILGLGVVLSAAAQVGVDLDGDLQMYGGTIIVKGNMEGDATSTFWKMQNGARIEDCVMQIYVEGSNGVAADIGAASWIRAQGLFKYNSSAHTVTFNADSGWNLSGNLHVDSTTLASGDNTLAAEAAFLVRLTGDAGGSTITGISGRRGGEGRILRLVNISGNSIVLGHQDTAETTANLRIISPTAADITLAQNDSAALYYDNTTTRWRIIEVTQ